MLWLQLLRPSSLVIFISSCGSWSFSFFAGLCSNCLKLPIWNMWMFATLHIHPMSSNPNYSLGFVVFLLWRRRQNGSRLVLQCDIGFFLICCCFLGSYQSNKKEIITAILQCKDIGWVNSQTLSGIVKYVFIAYTLTFVRFCLILWTIFLLMLLLGKLSCTCPLVVVKNNVRICS